MTIEELLKVIGALLGQAGPILGTGALGGLLTWLLTRREAELKIAKSEADLRRDLMIEISDLHKDLFEANRRNDELAELINQVRTSSREDKHQLSILNVTIASLRAENTALQVQIEQLRAERHVLQGQVDRMQEELIRCTAQHNEPH